MSELITATNKGKCWYVTLEGPTSSDVGEGNLIKTKKGCLSAAVKQQLLLLTTPEKPG